MKREGGTGRGGRVRERTKIYLSDILSPPINMKILT